MFVSGFLLVTAMLLALAVCLVRMRIVERELELAHRVLAKANLRPRGTRTHSARTV